MLLDPTHTLKAPKPLQRPLEPHVVRKGMLSIPPDSVFMASSSVTGSSSNACNKPITATSNLDSNLDLLSRKRTTDSLSKPALPNPKKRKVRTCQKCGNETCNGRKEVKYCVNCCRDCGKNNCKGRDSKRPNKPCWEND